MARAKKIKVSKQILDFFKAQIQESGALSEDELKSISDPKLIISLAEKVNSIDPRMELKITHKASTIMLVTLMGVFAGCQTWNEISDYGSKKLYLVQMFDSTVDSVPSHDTISRFFSIVKPDAIEELYRSWAANMQKMLRGKEDKVDKRHHIGTHYAGDGKVISGAIDPEKLLAEHDGEIDLEYAMKCKMHMVSLYDVNSSLSMSQERVDVKKGELSALPNLFDSIIFEEGDIVSLDALSTHANIAQAITDKGAYYLLEVKDNQKLLKRQIIKFIDDIKDKSITDLECMKFTEISHDHSCDTTRECIISLNKLQIAALAEKWVKLSTFGVVKTTKVYKDGKVLVENHYFITSMPKDPMLIMKHKREHWQIENGLHWHLDVTFNEDNSRKMMTSAQNYSLITKMVLPILKNDSRKLPINRKRKMAGWDDAYMIKLMLSFIKGM